MDPEARLRSHWDPPPPVWTRRPPSLTHTPPSERIQNRAPGSGGSCTEGFCPTWGTPRWKEDPNSCFCILWQATRRPALRRRFCPQAVSLQEQPGIPAQDSWRTSAVPCNRCPRRSPRWLGVQPVWFSEGQAGAPRFLRLYAAVGLLRTGLPLRHRIRFLLRTCPLPIRL